MWNLSEIDVRVDELRNTERPDWPASERMAHSTAAQAGSRDRRTNRRQIKGAQHYIDYKGGKKRRAFASHSPKQKTIGSYGQVMETIGLGPYDLRMTAEVVEALDRLKQWGFYVDCIGGSFQSPDMFAANEDEILDVVLAVADAGEVMPPKSTWFEPKLRDGLVVLLLGAPPGH